ncbi:MAG: adenylate/guanylate cyclase domain-containing protein [Ghiorsea sp.]
MNKLPESIRNYLSTYHLETLAPVWIELKIDSEIVKSVGGSWQNYFSELPAIGNMVSDSCELLQGMLPIQENFELPHMQLNIDKYTDILAFKDSGSDWLLFFDVTENVLQLQKYQQAANELHLLKDKLHNTLSRYMGNEIANRAINGDLKLKADGERKLISTLFVDIRGFTNYNEKVDAQEVMDTLNAYMEKMLGSILSNYGVVDKIMGDGIMAVFGILESQNNHVEDAFQAALDIQSNIKALNKIRGNAQLEVLGVGVGVATGEAVLGILGSHERRAFTAIGRHVNLAARLESNARAGEILIDESTLTSLATTPDYQIFELELKGIGKGNVYSITSEN